MTELNVYEYLTSNFYNVYKEYPSNMIAINENTLFKLVFSKAITDINFNNQNISIANSLLKSSDPSSFTMNNLYNNTFFFDENLKYKKKIPYNIYNINKNSAKDVLPDNNKNIIDFDITSLTNDNIVNYMLYLDIIYQIYDYAMYLKLQNKPIDNLTIPIYSRYEILKNNTLKITDKIKNFNLLFINNVLDTSDKSFGKFVSIFDLDISKHIKYAFGDDSKKYNYYFLKSIRDFYKYCRLKLQYLIVNSIFLIASRSKSININDVKNYSNTFIYYVFSNFFDKIKTYSSSRSPEILQKNIELNTTVLDKTQKLKTLNEELELKKSLILKRKLTDDKIKSEVKYQHFFEALAKFIFAFIVIYSIIIVAIDIGSNSKFLLLSIVALIIIIIKISLYKIVKPDYVEHFTNLRIFNQINEVLVHNLNNFSFSSSKLNDYIIPSLDKEYDYYDTLMKNLELKDMQSSSDLRVKLLEIFHSYYEVNLYINLSLIFNLSLCIYYYFENILLACIFFTLSLTLVIVLYSYKNERKVRNNAMNIYWRQDNVDADKKIQ